MKKNLLAFVALLVPFAADAQLFQLRSATSAYAWERQDTVGKSASHLFGYQSVQLSLAQNDVSFGTYFQWFNDFSGPVSNKIQSRLFTFYLQWRNIAKLVDVTVGRQALFAGAATGPIDGVKATARFWDSRIKISGFGGALLPIRQKAALISNVGSNYMAGGQVVIEPIEWIRASVSFSDKSIQQSTYNAIRRDTLFNPIVSEIKPLALRDQILSGDVEAEYQNFISGHVRYDYDTKAKKQSRMELFTRIKPVENLGITLEYLTREPRLLYNSFFSVFTLNTLTEFEGGLEYETTPSLQLFGKYGRVAYGDESENRVTLGGNWTYVSASFSRSVGVENELSAASLTAGYPLMDNVLTPTLMLSYAKYKLAQDAPLDAVLGLSAGVVYRPMKTLSVDTQLQWLNNPILSRDVRLFVRANYYFSQQLGLF